MAGTLRSVDVGRLERSCDSIRFAPGAPGLERAEVFLAGAAFELHRHDTYTIGVTTAGVQTFRYRGARRVSLPGQLVVLHPDELHDGGPGTAAGFGYRAIYVAPELVHEAVGHASLPFVPEPVQRPTGDLARVLSSFDEPVSDLARTEIAALVGDLLSRLAGGRDDRGPIDARAVGLARHYLAEHALEPTGSDTLEHVTGTDRFTLARHFRRAFGTSPDRYRTLRRLELARAAIERGEPLARVAAGTGFSDQSHLTRQFKRAYGMTPGRWATVTAR